MKFGQAALDFNVWIVYNVEAVYAVLAACIGYSSSKYFCMTLLRVYSNRGSIRRHGQGLELKIKEGYSDTMSQKYATKCILTIICQSQCMYWFPRLPWGKVAGKIWESAEERRIAMLF